MELSKVVFLLLFFSIVGCKNNEQSICDPAPTPVDKTITGYNVRWTDLPNFNTSEVVNLIDSLNPEMLRYPGGTLTHKWNWELGLSNNAGVNAVPHPISDAKILADVTQSQVIFVMDIVNRSVDNQIEMINTMDVPVNFIELGNELYSDDYEIIFPTGAAYADTINNWVPKLNTKFPAAKIGISLIGRTAGNDRKNNWNADLLGNLNVDIDAHIYHIYVGETETVQERIDRLNQVFVENTGKELWITEYGARSQNVDQAIELSNYIDSIAVISLNHCVLSKSQNFSKITVDGNNLTEEGEAFIDKYN